MIFLPKASLFFLLLAAWPTSGQQGVPEPLIRGVGLQEHGHPRDAIDVLEPLVQATSSLSPTQQGIAWCALGSAYQSMEEYREARHAYNEAISRLRSDISAQDQYAAALDNLGSLESVSGHFSEARALRNRASNIYRSLGNYAGTARTASNLAVLAFDQGDIREASRQIDHALHEESMTHELTADDLASISSVRGSIAMARGDSALAIAAQKEAIALWTAGYGPTFLKLGKGYTILAKIEGQAGDRKEALTSIRKAVEIEGKAALGTAGAGYLEASIIYGRLLKASGQREAGMQLERQSLEKLTLLRHSRNSSDTISVESFQ